MHTLPTHPAARARRGFATALVLWAVAISSIVLVSLQVSAWRQAAAGREEVARVRAKWAARSGIEAMIARLQSETQQSQPVGPGALLKALADDAQGELAGCSFRVGTSNLGRFEPGAEDTGALININTMTREDLMLLSGMTEDIADAILSWINGDSDTSFTMYNADYYRGLPHSYVPRGKPIRSLAELELVAGVTPDLIRGEDWNLNGVLDANENDGNASWPPDNADGVLDRGWSAIITASSSFNALGPSGEPRLDLKSATANEVAALLRLESLQADAIVAYAQADGATMETLISTDLNTLYQQVLQQQQQQQQQAGGFAGTIRGGRNNRTPTVRALTRDQTAMLYDDCSIGPPKSGQPGKINLNTVSRETLNYLASVDPATADAIIAHRDSAGGELTSIVDLLDIQGMTTAQLAELAAKFDVRSSVFAVTSRGKDAATGTEVEIRAEIDRSRLPVVIRTLIVR
ncbi:MAG: helix-hairpin-helix domain-containing protein [Phycisphaeraceae bacterium]|nr:helix-hairpin-helix domain-containing protein [Phycisphaeraceae bacterium]